MTKRLVIFGTGPIAALAHHYFTTDSAYDIVGFTVDRAYLETSVYCGLPVVAFDEVAVRFPPDSHDCFVALSYARLNTVRRDRYHAAGALGYVMARYISSRADVADPSQIGAHCFILEGAVVQPFTVVGDNVTVWSGSHIGHHGSVGDHVFIGSARIAGGVTIGEQSFVGVGAVVRDGVVIGPRCVIGAGALILEDAEPEGVYMGSATARSRVPSTRLRGL